MSELQTWLRVNAPWLLGESTEERARRVCREADHLQVMFELEQRWRFLLALDGLEPANVQVDEEDTVSLRLERRAG